MEEVARSHKPQAPTQSSQTPVSSLSFRQLEIFHAIMETGSVNAASRMLGISQPSLSRSLRRLEDQLRLKLYRRQRQRLVPTNEAHRIFEVVAPAIHQIRAIKDSVINIAEGQTSLFRFAATQSVARTLVPRAISAMRMAEPGIGIFLDTISRGRHIEYLLNKQGECILSLADLVHPMIMSREIARAPLVAIVNKEHPLSNEGCVSPEMLIGQSLILFERSGPHSAAIETFMGSYEKPICKTYIRFSDAALGLVAEGVGVALIDDFTAMGWLPPEVVRIPLADPPLFTVRLYTNIEHPGSHFVERLGNTLVSLIKESGHA